MKQLLFSSLLLLQLFQAQAQISLSLEKVTDGFSQPVDIASAGDDRLFIVEKDGVIKILHPDGKINPAPFLDIDDRVRSNGSNSGEQGLLGLAFHPKYTENGFFFVNYIEASGNTVIARFKVSSGDPDKADPASEKIILTVNQPDPAHNAGDINFSPKDGFLYIALGDGGLEGDYANNTQNRQQLLGKVLRIDVDNGDPYAIPTDNPFVADDATRSEIWAIGLRNPWRFSFDRLTSDLWIGDVGQDHWEEINFQLSDSKGGQNYGWPCYEGKVKNVLIECGDISNFTFPAWVYDSDLPLGCSVNGGFVYRGNRYPLLQGLYLYSDFCSGKIWALHKEEQGEWSNEELYPGKQFEFVTMGEDRQGELFIASISGTIYRLTEATTTGISETFTQTGIQVSPNPFKDQFAVKAQLKESGTYRLQLLNTQGQVVWEQISFLDTVMDLQIDTRNMSKGIYLFALQRNGVRDMIKVIKQ